MSHITFHLENDDHKPVGINIQRKTFTCQLEKIRVTLDSAHRFQTPKLNLNFYLSEHETDELLLSITKNCAPVVNQNQKESQQTVQFVLSLPMEAFSFTSPLNQKRKVLT